MTINETSFFRDVRPFDLLRTELLPPIIEARRRTRTLRFWSAACSTGQEGYSLAMMLLEHFPMLVGWNLSIEGTDLSGEVVERAQAGRYHRIEINRGLPARLRRALLRPRWRGLDCQARGPQALQLPPGQSLRSILALQPANRPIRCHLPAQRHALLLHGYATHAAGRHSPASRKRWDSLPRLQRTTRRSLALDLATRRRNELLSAKIGELTCRSAPSSRRVRKKIAQDRGPHGQVQVRGVEGGASRGEAARK